MTDHVAKKSSLLHQLYSWSKEDPEASAQRFLKDGFWVTWTVTEYLDRVHRLAIYLQSIGFGKGDISAIYSYNRPAWAHADLAPSLVGGASAGIYPNSNLEDIHYILKHTEAKVLFVQNETYFHKMIGKNAEKPLPDSIKKIIVFDGKADFDPRAISYEKCLEEARKIKTQKPLDDYLKNLDPDAPAFIVFTSGTTGVPKGAMLSHDNFYYAATQTSQFWKTPKNGELFSFLPISHVAEKLHSLGIGITCRYQVSYCSAFEHVAEELKQVEPNLLLCVPRLWEKFMEGVQAKVDQASPTKKKLVKWAFDVGGRMRDGKYKGKPFGVTDWIEYQLAERLVFSKLKKALGLGKVLLCASGAAPLSSRVSQWFAAMGIQILEVCAQTESSALLLITVPNRDCWGTAGIPAPGIDFQLTESGEIITRGRHVFKGYLKDPTSTQKTIQDGWLYTGDLGSFTKDGLVKLIGRTKEIIKTSGGKMIAPAPLEDKIKTHPMVAQVCLVGESKKFISALVTLSEGKRKELETVSGATQGEVVQDAATIEELRKHFELINQDLASFEKIKRFTILAHDFDIEKGEMTPTLKMKRSTIEKNYLKIIDGMYVGGDTHET